MNESFRPFAFFVGFMVFWVVLNKWVLPRFGVRTGLGGSCAASPRQETLSEPQPDVQVSTED